MIAYRRIMIVVPFLACVLARAQSTALERGLDFFQHEDYEAALQQLQAASQSHPTDASIHNFVGITETKLDRVEEANLEYKTAARLDPNLPGPEKNLAFNYLSTGQYELAEEPLKVALALGPADPSVHYYLAILYLSTSRNAEAVPHIQPAQNLLENDPATGMLAVKVCLQSGHADEALKLIHSFERGSLLTVAQEYEAAQWLTEQQMYVEAVPRFEKIVQMQPASWGNKYNLAIALLKAKQPENARLLLAPMAAEHAGNANILGMLGSAYDLEGKPALALDAYLKAIAADRKNPDRYLDCTRVMIDLNEFNEAVVLLQRGIGAVPDPYTLTIRMGAIEMMQGHYEKARGGFEEAIREHPDVALGYVALAQTHMKEGNDRRAIEVLTDGRGKVARDFALEYVLGLVSFEVGQQRQALAALKNAEELGPSVVEPHYQLGMLYMQMRQWIDAQGEFESVLRLDPQHAATFYQLSRTYRRTGDAEKAQQMAKEASLLTRTQREGAVRSEQLRLGVPTQP